MIQEYWKKQFNDVITINHKDVKVINRNQQTNSTYTHQFDSID